MSDEIELKLDMGEGALNAVRSLPLLAEAKAETNRQLSIYFDTPGAKLGKQGCTLRLRLAKGGWVQTVKLASAAGGLVERREWEWEAAGEQPEPERLAGLPIEVGSLDRLARKLVPVLRSEVERTSWQVEVDDSRVQVDLDAGTLSAGERRTGIEELEFELLDGPATVLGPLARQVVEQLPARLGVLSKSDRGTALMDGNLGRPAKAAPLEVTSDLTVAQAFAAIVHACLKHFRLNEDVVIACRDPVALHQARVAMRRLRSAFTLFKPAIAADPKAAFLREELRWFTNQLGEARDLDVYLTRDLPAEERARAFARREITYSQVIEAMNDARSRMLMVELTGWAFTGSWRDGSRAVGLITPFAAKRMDRLWGSVEPTGRSLTRMEEEARHQLRIQVKKLRYAVEFFDRLYPSKDKKRFREAAEQVQEALGRLNDLRTARAMNRNQEDSWLQEQSEELAHLQHAELAVQKMAKAGPFWRTQA